MRSEAIYSGLGGLLVEQTAFQEAWQRQLGVMNVLISIDYPEDLLDNESCR